MQSSHSLNNIVEINNTNLYLLDSLIHSAIDEGWQDYEFIEKYYYMVKNKITLCSPKKGFITHTLDVPVAYCSFLYVMPEERNKGLGFELKNESELWLRREGVGIVRTYTYETNKPVIQLNTKLGYEITSKQEGWVRFQKIL